MHPRSPRRRAVGAALGGGGADDIRKSTAANVARSNRILADGKNKAPQTAQTAQMKTRMIFFF
jgi:hypothetical protein